MGRLKERTAPTPLSDTDIRVLIPATRSELKAVRSLLFVECAGTLTVDLCSQNFNTELAMLPVETQRHAVVCCWSQATVNSRVVAQCAP